MKEQKAYIYTCRKLRFSHIYARMGWEKFRKNVVGIVIGDFIGVDDDESFKELLDELSTKYQVNIVKTSVFSHSKIKTTVPCGAAALIDNDKIIIKDYLI